MSLPAGTRLGPYEVIAPIGAGGMGEVYRARDTRLGREVAVKVLPQELAHDPERLRRFEQEARAASALSHPNILTLFDVAAPESAPYLVTELLDGHSLRAVIGGKGLPLRQVQDYALQTARGLAAAHGRGIVHRDLKPDNLFVTADGRVKILDFGLARLTQPELGADGTGTAVTQATLTREGTVVGTVAYLSPEALSGQPIDAAADVFAYGAVLHEMLSGRPAFQRATAAETMSAILRDEPPPLARSDVPPALQHVLERCLAKRPEDRFGSGREVAIALEVVGAGSGSVAVPAPATGAGAGSRRRWAERIAFLALGAALVSGAVAALGRRAKPPTAGPIVSSLSFPPESGWLSWRDAGQLVVAPDGSRLAYVGVGRNRRSAVFVRELSSTTVRELQGTSNARGVFWSPDGRFVGFVAEDKLRKVPVDGGPVQVLADGIDQETAMSGASWSRDGVILFTTGGAIERVPAEGGRPQVVVRRGAGELFLRFPSFFPDGRRFLYQVRPEQGPARTYAGSLDAGVAPTLVQEGQSRAVLAATGHLLYVQDGVLFARRFDERGLRLVGEPQPIATRIAGNPGIGSASFSVAERGPLVYTEGGPIRPELVVKDRRGRVLERLSDVGRYLGPALDRTGRQLVVEMEDSESGQHTVWVLDTARGTRSRLTRAPYDGHHPVWSPDGKALAFTSSRTGKWLAYRQRTDGLGEDTLLHDGPELLSLYPRVWTSDGRGIVAAAQESDGRRRLWWLPARGDGAARPMVDGNHAALSPDGRWLAVEARHAGRSQIHVLPFPALDTRFAVSVDGGRWPRWRSDGRELFYVSEDVRLMSVPVAAGDAFDASAPVALFPLPVLIDQAADFPAPYDVERGGERFVFCLPPDNLPPPLATLVTNWEALLRGAPK
jgi:Tol biopolymer transport system component